MPTFFLIFISLKNQVRLENVSKISAISLVDAGYSNMSAFLDPPCVLKTQVIPDNVGYPPKLVNGVCLKYFWIKRNYFNRKVLFCMKPLDLLQ